MKNQIRNLAERIAARIYEMPKSGSYTPILILVVGGTGNYVARELKRLLAPHMAQYIRILAIDSDASENTRHLTQFPPLELGRELLILDQSQALRMLANAQAGTSNRHVLEYLPVKTKKHGNVHELVIQKINQQRGAGQFRRAGRLLLDSNVNGGANLDSALAKVREELIGLATVLRREAEGANIETNVKVIIVESLAGGQGSSTSPQLLALVRKHFNGPHDTITVFAVLPGHLYDKRVRNPLQEGPVMRSNAIGALSELQAAKLGWYSDHEFVFDQNTRFTPKLLPLVNDIMLVDHHSHKRVPYNDLIDLCKGIGAFIYGFVATGLGAHSESAQINDKTDNRPAPDGMPRIFSSIGVGALVYPATELLEYGIRDALGRWLNEWIEQNPSAEANREDIATVLGSWQMESLDSLRARFQPQVREATYLSDTAQRRAVLKLADPEFLGKGESKLNGFPGELAGYEDSFAENQRGVETQLVQAIHAQVSEWLTAGAKSGTVQLTALRTAIGTLKSALVAARDERVANRQRLLDRKDVLTRKINFWGFGLDAGYRKEFLNVVNSLLTLQLQERTDASLGESLHVVEKALTSLAAEVENFISDLKVTRDNNATELSRMAAADTESCFLQPVITPTEYPQWAKENEAEVPRNLKPESFSADQFIHLAVDSVADFYLSRRNQFDLAARALEDPELMRRLKTIETASDYMMHLDLLSPPVSQLKPQKFLAGYLDRGNKKLVDQFSPPDGGAQVVPVETTNKHMVICARTLHGFPAAHWSGFDVAEAYYRQDPWWAHTVEDFASLPPLKPLSGQRARALQYLGLGLVFELIYTRGSNYYANLKEEELNSVRARWHVYYKKGLSPGGAALIEAGLVTPAPSSQTRVRSEHLMGKSLSETLETLAKPDTGTFITLVDEVLGEFTAKAGVDRLKTIIEDYVQNELDKRIDGAADTRRDLEEVARELRAYAQRIG